MPLNVYINFNSAADLNLKNAQGFKCKYGDPQGCSQEGGSYGGSISCGVGKRSRIVGGKQAKPSEFPWQVGFRWETENSRTNIFCGGSLIDKTLVVSAAHCFQDINRPIHELKIVLGEFDVNNEEGNEVVIAARKVEKEGWVCVIQLMLRLHGGLMDRYTRVRICQSLTVQKFSPKPLPKFRFTFSSDDKGNRLN